MSDSEDLLDITTSLYDGNIGNEADSEGGGGVDMEMT